VNQNTDHWGGITFLSLARPAFTKNGSETPVVLPA